MLNVILPAGLLMTNSTLAKESSVLALKRDVHIWGGPLELIMKLPGVVTDETFTHRFQKHTIDQPVTPSDPMQKEGNPKKEKAFNVGKTQIPPSAPPPSRS